MICTNGVKVLRYPPQNDFSGNQRLDFCIDSLRVLSIHQPMGRDLCGMSRLLPRWPVGRLVAEKSVVFFHRIHGLW